MLEYRKAVPEDIGELVKLRMEMISEGTNYKKSFLNTIEKNTGVFLDNEMKNNNFITWVALDDGIIVSMCALSLYSLPPNDWCVNGKTGYIGNIYTRPRYRKRGIAKVLLTRLIQEAKECRCERLVLYTTEMGRSIYEQLGFKNSPDAMAFYPFGIACDMENTNSSLSIM